MDSKLSSARRTFLESTYSEGTKCRRLCAKEGIFGESIRRRS